MISSPPLYWFWHFKIVTIIKFYKILQPVIQQTAKPLLDSPLIKDGCIVLFQEYNYIYVNLSVCNALINVFNGPETLTTGIFVLSILGMTI